MMQHISDCATRHTFYNIAYQDWMSSIAITNKNDKKCSLINYGSAGSTYWKARKNLPYTTSLKRFSVLLFLLINVHNQYMMQPI